VPPAGDECGLERLARRRRARSWIAGKSATEMPRRQMEVGLGILDGEEPDDLGLDD
jgi:hypothetical protein